MLAYDKGLVIRISNPYRANPVGKTDFVHKMLERLEGKQEVVAPTDQLFAPTFIDDVAASVDKFISINATGIYHVVGSLISPYEAAKIIATIYEKDISLVQPTTFAEYFFNRAPTPQYAVLKNDKIITLGVPMHDFLSGIEGVHRQETAIS